jgi:PIN domain-containing protein
MPPARLLVIDENLPRRLSTELTNRGRGARRLADLGLKGVGDLELLTRLAGEHDDWILVTADDRMPLDHADPIEALAATIATIDPRRRDGYNVDQWRREIAHRWAHAIHEQDAGTVLRYSLSGKRAWRPRRG